MSVIIDSWLECILFIYIEPPFFQAWGSFSGGRGGWWVVGLAQARNPTRAPCMSYMYRNISSFTVATESLLRDYTATGMLKQFMIHI